MTQDNNKINPDSQSLQMAVICRLFGHKESKYTDSGYPYCEKCGCHSYYNSVEWYNSGILMRPFWRIKARFFQLKCDLKHKFRRIFLNDKLPF